MKFSRLTSFLLIVLALLGCFMIVRLLRKQDQASPTNTIQSIVAPAPKPYKNAISATGLIEANQENINIAAPYAALVTHVNVNVNDEVKKNQTLFLLDDREARATLLTAQAQIPVAQAKVNVQQALLEKQKNLTARTSALQNSRAISREEIDSRQQDLLIAQSQLDLAQAELAQTIANAEKAKISLDRCTVTSPKNATILQLNIRPGEFISNSPNQPALLLGSTQQFQIRADIDEENALRIRPNQTATAYLKGHPDQPLPLTFTRIEPYVIPKVSLTGTSTERVDTRVLQVIFSLQRPKDFPIYVGQQVDIYIQAPEK